MPETVNHTDGAPFLRLPASTLDVFRTMIDVTSAVSDVLDGLGIRGAIPASVLRPILDDTSIVGQAVTIRNVPLTEAPSVAAQHAPQLDVVSVHDVSGPGDVLVIEGVHNCSNFGGLAALMAKQRGRAGAVIAGGARDISLCRKADFPMWIHEFTPIAGKHRVRTVAVNADVTIEGIFVRPGDVVIADATGVCFIPIERVEEVAAKVAETATKETAIEARLRGEQ